MKKQSNRGNDKNFILAIKNSVLLLVFITYGCNFSGYNLDGNWEIVNSEIFLTSNIDEKEEFYKSCFQKNVVIEGDEIYFPLPDNCFDVKSNIKIINEKTCKRKELPINNLDRFFSSLGWRNDSNSQNKKITYFEGLINNEKEQKKVLIFRVDEVKVAIYQDPYLLMLRKSK